MIYHDAIIIFLIRIINNSPLHLSSIAVAILHLLCHNNTKTVVLKVVCGFVLNTALFSFYNHAEFQNIFPVRSISECIDRNIGHCG